MICTLDFGNAIGVTDAFSAGEILKLSLPDSLSQSAKLIHGALVATAIETAKRRGYSSRVTHVTVFLPLEVLSFVCGIHRVTAWRNLKLLKEMGLVDYRPLKDTLRGETRNSGCLFQIRLHPTIGKRARLSYDDLKHKWRDLQQDVYAKKTAYRQLNDLMQLSDKNPMELDIEPLLQWTLPPQHSKPPLRSDCCKPLEVLLDVVSTLKQDRNNMVKLAAEALSSALADSGSVSWYQRLLWQLLRTYDASGEDYSYQVYLAAIRARTDYVEGFAKRAGALFHSRLKQAEWFSEVINSPPLKVGTKPASV